MLRHAPNRAHGRAMTHSMCTQPLIMTRTLWWVAAPGAKLELTVLALAMPMAGSLTDSFDCT